MNFFLARLNGNLLLRLDDTNLVSQDQTVYFASIFNTKLLSILWNTL